MSTTDKVLTAEQLPRWRDSLRQSGRRLVVTNGCFDLIHVGHVHYLEEARNLGDALLIGVNGDESVRQLKGPERPLNTESDRARVLAALGCVDGVVIFPEVRADRFLAQSAPDIYVKGAITPSKPSIKTNVARSKMVGGASPFLSSWRESQRPD